MGRTTSHLAHMRLTSRVGGADHVIGCLVRMHELLETSLVFIGNE